MFKKSTRNSYIYLLIGFIFLFFYNGKWIIPISALITPILLIRFYRFHKPIKGLFFIVIAGWISNIFIWKGMMPIDGVFYYILMFMMSLFTGLVYMIDKIISPKIKGVISTFIFPSTYVIMEYIVVSTNPSGSYGTLAHTQDYLPFLQIMSITGIWGIVFLINWTASMINWLCDYSFDKSKLKLSLLVFGLPVILTILFGQTRLLINSTKNTVRIASININKKALFNHYNPENDSLTTKSNNNFLSNCAVAASSGSKIVFGSETIIKLRENNEKDFIDKAKIVAQQQNIYIGLPMEVILEGFPNVRPENKIVWISPQGKTLFIYHKAKPTPGEGDYGDGVIKYFDSPYGRISSVICFDMDFPTFIKQIKNKNIDIMLVPGNDWSEITPYHTYVASARAIEHGFNLVRSVSRGFSASFNYKGQLLSSMDFYDTDELIMYSDLPIKGTKTVYSVLDDFFAWMCITFLGVVISHLILKNIKSKNN